MGSKRTIKARDIVNDIRAGLTNLQLMEKYQLSSKGLISIFTKLTMEKAVRQEELQGRSPLADDTVALEHKRLWPRNYLCMLLPIFESDNHETQGCVRDITEKGVQVVGIPAEPGETKRFVVRPKELAEINEFSFDARCRWVEPDSDGNGCVAGFAITNISKNAVQDLRRLVRALTLGD
jgi:hypothetical protein